MSSATSSKPAATLEVLNTKQHGVRVEFYWTGDRFAHTISGVRDNQAEQLLESVEGDPNDRFPASPPCVELHRQEEAIFLTGATDAGHWSMSVEQAGKDALSAFYQTGIAEYSHHFLLFDIACRLRTECGKVASEYKTFHLEGKCIPAGQSAIAANGTGKQPFSVIVSPVSKSHQEDACRIGCHNNQTSSGGMTIAPAAQTPADFPATVRWKYGIFWALE